MRGAFQSIVRPRRSSHSKRSGFENSSAANRVRIIHCFSTQSVVVPEFLSDESIDEIWKSLLQAVGDSGIDPAIVYGMNKTGRIVTETKVHFLTDAELQEWNDAVDEYRQKVEAAETQ